MRNDRGLLQLLYKQGLLTEEQAREAYAKAREAGIRVATYLRQNRLVEEIDLVKAIASASGTEVIENIYEVKANQDALEKINESIASRYKVLPLSYDQSRDTLVVIAPVNQIRSADLKDNLKLVSGVKHIEFKTSTLSNIELGITLSYRAEMELARIAAHSAEEDRKAAEEESTKAPADEVIEVQEESPVVRFVNLILQQAISDKASDIHIEPDENIIRVRFRIDGVLHDVNQAPGHLGPEISSRIKILSDLDIAKKHLPQDGRLTYIHERAGKIDLRVSTLPTVWGEKIVMRILDNSSASLALQELGFSEYNLERFKSAYKKPYGMILVTGPTGSGKSTTLYAALNEITSPSINIITVEDPVEYRIPRINQVQVRAKQGLTFAAALRSILRNDPDVILVGEIRDHETAQIAVESGLTGHLVLSTLHTNSAASAITRLTEMGIEPFLVGSVVEAVLAQRLIRKLCANCKEEYIPEREALENIEFPLKEEGVPTIYRPVGCPQCAGTGYRGRMAVHEVLLVDPYIEKMAVEGKTSTDIENYAREHGMRVLKEDGWERVLSGQTSIEEILRVIA